MATDQKRAAVPDELQRLIPSDIQKGIYYRLYPRKDGTTRLVWWVKLYDRKGSPIYESSDSSLYSDAVSLYKKMTAEIEGQQRAGGDAGSVKISQLLDEFVEHGSKAAEKTKYVYRLVIESHLKRILGKIRAAKLTTDHMLAYRKQRKAELLSKKLKSVTTPSSELRSEWARSADATANRELAVLRGALEYASKQTPPKVIRVPSIPMVSERNNVRKVVLQDSDYATLRDSFNDAGVRLLFIVSSHVGIRASELRRIKWTQVDLDRRVIVLERNKTKNRDARGAPIFGDMLEHLRAAKQERDEFYPDSPWVFNRVGEPIKNFRDAWDKAVRAAGVPDLHFHDLRRTAQRLMRRAGIDRATRMKIMGHKSDSMDIRYGVVEDEDVVNAGVKLDDAFRSTMGNRNADRNSAPVATVPSPAVNPDLLLKLAAIPEAKLKALLALLST